MKHLSKILIATIIFISGCSSSLIIDFSDNTLEGKIKTSNKHIPKLHFDSFVREPFSLDVSQITLVKQEIEINKEYKESLEAFLNFKYKGENHSNVGKDTLIIDVLFFDFDAMSITQTGFSGGHNQLLKTMISGKMVSNIIIKKNNKVLIERKLSNPFSKEMDLSRIPYPRDMDYAINLIGKGISIPIYQVLLELEEMLNSIE